LSPPKVTLCPDKFFECVEAKEREEENENPHMVTLSETCFDFRFSSWKGQHCRSCLWLSQLRVNESLNTDRRVT
jgi:hypothetical protein